MFLTTKLYLCILQNESRTPYAFNPLLVRREKLFYNLTHRLEELCSKIEGKPSTLCITDKLRGKDMPYLTKVSEYIFSYYGQKSFLIFVFFIVPTQILTSLRHHFETTGLSKIESERLVDQIRAILLEHLRSKPNGK